MLTLYSQPGCQPCRMIKLWLSRQEGLVEGEHYAIKDVTLNEYDYAFVKGLGYTGTPVVVLPNGEHFHGLDSTRLDEWLAGLSL